MARKRVVAAGPIRRTLLLALIAAAGLASSHALADNPPTDTNPTTTVTQPAPAPAPKPDPAPATQPQPAQKKKPAPKPAPASQPTQTTKSVTPPAPIPSAPATTPATPAPAPVQHKVVTTKPKKAATPPSRVGHKIRPAAQPTPAPLRVRPQQIPKRAPAASTRDSVGVNWGLVAIVVAIVAFFAVGAVAQWRSFSRERAPDASPPTEQAPDAPPSTDQPPVVPPSTQLAPAAPSTQGEVPLPIVIALATSSPLPEQSQPPPPPPSPVPAEVDGGETSNGRWKTCEIVWWRGYWKSNFYAQAVTPEGFAYDVARSRPFSWRGSEEPPKIGEIASAHSVLVEKLLANGWEETGNGTSWYARRYRRPLEPTASEASSGE